MTANKGCTRIQVVSNSVFQRTSRIFSCYFRERGTNSCRWPPVAVPKRLDKALADANCPRDLRAVQEFYYRTDKERKWIAPPVPIRFPNFIPRLDCCALDIFKPIGFLARVDDSSSDDDLAIQDTTIRTRAGAIAARTLWLGMCHVL